MPSQMPSNDPSSTKLAIIVAAVKPAAKPTTNIFWKAPKNKVVVGATSAATTRNFSYDKYQDVKTKNADRQIKLAPLQEAEIKKFIKGDILHDEFLNGYNYYGGDASRATSIIKAVNAKRYKK